MWWWNKRRAQRLATRDLGFAPPAFTNANGDRIIFVDFTEAEYVIDFDVQSQTAWVNSSVKFSVDAPGLPAFDLGILPDRVALNGKTANVLLQPSPGRHTDYKVVMQRVAPGTHSLHVEHGLHGLPASFNPLLWTDDGVHCIFQMTDLNIDPDLGGRYLSSYLPSNLEYDHYAYTLKIRLSGTTTPHTVIANGAVTEVGLNQFLVAFPSSFTGSCPLLVIGPTPQFQSRSSILRSVDGRDLPVSIHGVAGGPAAGHLDAFEQETGAAITSLESNFGPFPYDRVTVFALNLESGGMEHAGAAVAGLRSVRHELDHSYFARCITPVDGDSGWIDEAIASWGDANYPTSSSPPARGSSMGRKSPYNRITDHKAYTHGREFLSYLDYRFAGIGGLRPVLKRYFQDMKFRAATNATFKATLESALGASLQEEFETYVFGQEHVAVADRPADAEANPHHCHDAAQIRELLLPRS